MARVTGLEPATSGVTGRHSNRLSYTRAFRSDVAAVRERLTKGFDPECQASFKTKMIEMRIFDDSTGFAVKWATCFPHLDAPLPLLDTIELRHSAV